MESPLLFPVTLNEKTISVLDETKIPHQIEYLSVTTLEEALCVVREMKTRSLGQVLLFFYSCVLFSDAYALSDIVYAFRKQRPTFDFPLLGDLLISAHKKGMSLFQAVQRFIAEFDSLRKKRAAYLARLLPHPASLATICNVNGELGYVYEALRKLGKEACFFVCETRPYLQGTRLTFWELKRNNIPAKVLCDSQVASLMSKGEINCVVTGADRATTRGDIINKIGTYSLARLAKHFNIPFYALTQYPRDMESSAIEIEERPGEEVFLYLDGDYTEHEAVYPSFDVTPSAFITQCVELEKRSETGKH